MEVLEITNKSSQDESLLQTFFQQMLTIRIVEERLLRLFSEGLLNGTVHTCLGQEACAVGVVNAIDRERDIIFSNHRGHGHFLTYCDNVPGLIGELMGRRSGVCAGVGGSQHLHQKNFYSNGILGGIAPVATGMAFAEKAKKTGSIVMAFLGDGSFGEGVVYEAFNIASLWQLPILFVSELNGWAQSTPTHLEQSGNLELRGQPFAIQSTAIDVKNVADVYAAAQKAVHYVRSRSLPAFLFLRTYRLGPHSKGDDNRDPVELEEYRNQDPLLRLKHQLDPAWCQDVEGQIVARVEEAVEAARQTPVADFYELEAQWLT
jgi:acetoin:2,6-dichlorophenolindophenol oxidoreductase subunit alpha